MRVYIAYKYRSIPDKESLKNELEAISMALNELQHQPFVLARDIQRWHSSSSSVFKTIPHIVSNMLKSDLIFAYVNSDTSSWGLSFEMFCCKLFKKPLILAIKKGIKQTLGGVKPQQTIEFSETQDLIAKIHDLKI